MADPREYGRLVWSDNIQLDSIGRYLGRFVENDRPTAPQEGQEILDISSLTFYKYNGEAWVEMSSAFLGRYDSDNQPTATDEPATGKIIYREDIDEFRIWSGAEWVTIGIAGAGGGFQIIRRTDFDYNAEPNDTVFRTDDNTVWLYDSENDQWLLMASIRGSFRGEFTSFPTDSDLPNGRIQGDTVYRSDLGELYFWDGQYWIEV